MAYIDIRAPIRVAGEAMATLGVVTLISVPILPGQVLGLLLLATGKYLHGKTTARG